MRQSILILILVVFLTCDVIGLDEYCYATDSEKLQTLRYGTKTAYLVVKGAMTPKDYQVPSCSPTKMWHMSRHGTRLPTRKNLIKMSQLGEVRDEIVANYKVRRSQPTSGGLCSDDLNQLQNWKWNNSITPDHAEALTFQGYEDMFYMAKNYQNIFPNIYSTSTMLKIMYSGSESYVKDQKVVGNDTLLKPYEYCPLWILEYDEDIKYFYKAGYGNPLNLNQPCEAVKDMLKFLENDSPSTPKAAGYFTHSTMVQMFVSALGINNDHETMKADDYPRNANRKYRISKSGPFAANIAAVSYHCPYDTEPKKVIFFLNQKPVELDGCKTGRCVYNLFAD
uniref:Multiple inositol polyphosphate phosphatase 1 n=1 Tax=Megaselia scalaris TaxID=36166 RepID=T1GEJ6_MEGSC